MFCLLSFCLECLGKPQVSGEGCFSHTEPGRALSTEPLWFSLTFLLGNLPRSVAPPSCVDGLPPTGHFAPNTCIFLVLLQYVLCPFHQDFAQLFLTKLRSISVSSFSSPLSLMPFFSLPFYILLHSFPLSAPSDSLFFPRFSSSRINWRAPGACSTCRFPVI